MPSDLRRGTPEDVRRMSALLGCCVGQVGTGRRANGGLQSVRRGEKQCVSGWFTTPYPRRRDEVPPIRSCGTSRWSVSRAASVLFDDTEQEGCRSCDRIQAKGPCGGVEPSQHGLAEVAEVGARRFCIREACPPPDSPRSIAESVDGSERQCRCISGDWRGLWNGGTDGEFCRTAQGRSDERGGDPMLPRTMEPGYGVCHVRRETTDLPLPFSSRVPGSTPA